MTFLIDKLSGEMRNDAKNLYCIPSIGGLINQSFVKLIAHYNCVC